MRMTAGGFVLLFGLFGCTHQLDVRFKADTGCEDVTSRENLGAGLIEVRGCGYRVRYVCTGGGFCVREREESAAPPPTRASRPAVDRGPPQGVHTGRSADGRRGVRLVLRDGQSTLIVIGVPADGEQLRVEATDYQNQSIDGCRSYRLLAMRASDGVDIPLDPGTITVSELRAFREKLLGVQLCNHRLRVGEHELAFVDEFLERFDAIAAEPEAAPTTEPTLDPAALRAQIDEKKAGVLACLGGEAGALELSWDFGALTVRVAGAPDSDPVHGCVEAALGSIEPPGGSGELMHPVAP